MYLFYDFIIEPFEGTSVDVDQLEVPRGEIGEVILTGWHVNVKQVTDEVHVLCMKRSVFIWNLT